MFNRNVASITKGLAKMAADLRAHADAEVIRADRTSEKVRALADKAVALRREAARAEKVAANIEHLLED